MLYIQYIIYIYNIYSFSIVPGNFEFALPISSDFYDPMSFKRVENLSGLKQDPWEGKRCSPESELQGSEIICFTTNQSVLVSV